MPRDRSVPGDGCEIQDAEKRGAAMERARMRRSVRRAMRNRFSSGDQPQEMNKHPEGEWVLADDIERSLRKPCGLDTPRMAPESSWHPDWDVMWHAACDAVREMDRSTSLSARTTVPVVRMIRALLSHDGRIRDEAEKRGAAGERDRIATWIEKVHEERDAAVDGIAAHASSALEPCMACGWSCRRHPETNEEPPIVKGALDAQQDAEKEAFRWREKCERLQAALMVCMVDRFTVSTGKGRVFVLCQLCAKVGKGIEKNDARRRIEHDLLCPWSVYRSVESGRLDPTAHSRPPIAAAATPGLRLARKVVGEYSAVKDGSRVCLHCEASLGSASDQNEAHVDGCPVPMSRAIAGMYVAADPPEETDSQDGGRPHTDANGSKDDE